MFETLMHLPLFQGLCHEDFACILDKVKLSFNQYPAGSFIVQKGNLCNELCFLLNGDAFQITTSKNQQFTVIEKISSPAFIEPYSLFGMNPCYSSDYQACTKVETVSFSKNCLLNILLEYEIFRLNFINTICNRSHNLYASLWADSRSDLLQRIIYFMLAHFERAQGEKIIQIRVVDLAQLLGERSKQVSAALHKLQDQGIIQLSPKKIFIPEASKLRWSPLPDQNQPA